jgi:deazaflavin-dependent oxidoreductase (nitroreductase family)
MSTARGRDAAVLPADPACPAPVGPGPAPRQAAPGPANAIRLGPRARRLIRSIARVVNPVVLRFAGGRHLPVLGVIHHSGRRTGQRYATPLGIRPAAGGFVMPLTFGEAAGWYRNVRAAGWCVITWRGDDHTVASPVIVDSATALPAFPRYERLALRLIGIRQFVWLRCAPAAASPGFRASIKLRAHQPPPPNRFQ